MGKGSQTTTNQTSSSADPQAAQAYRDLLTRAQGVASTPYQAYTGELTAPVNAQQQLGIGNINQNANFAQPFVQQAAGIASGAANPLTQQQIQQYQNPYTQNVVDATQAQFNRNNAQQQEALKGNQIASGAFGGNRNGIGAANLSSQQATQQNPIIAGLYSNSYNQGVATAGQQFQQNPLAAGNAIANFGLSGQGAALSGAGAQLGAGTLQQQTQQQADTARYGQYAQGQAFPYQQAQWLAGIGTGVGSQLGGTSSGSTTGPAPNQFAQYAGAGLAAAGLFLNRGGRVGYADGGGVVPMHMADGGMPGTPWSQGVGWIPQMNIHPGSGAPKGVAPSLQNPQSNFDPVKFAQGITGLGTKGGSDGWGNRIGSYFNPDAYGGGNGVYGGSSSSPLAGLDASDYGAGYAHGGGVAAGYAGGGAPDDVMSGDPSWTYPDVGMGYPQHGVGPISFNERAEPVRQAIAGGNFDPMGGNSTEFRGTRGMETANAGVVPLPNARPKGIGAPAVAEDDEEGGVPPPAVRSAGVAPAGGVAAFAPEGVGSYRNMPDAVTRPQDKSGFGLGVLAPNTKTGLLAAGLGMLASRSPNLGNAIGEGGIAGVTAYGNANEADRKAIAEAEKLSREAWKTSEDLRLRGATQAETGRHNLATEKQAVISSDKTKFIPAGSTITADGAYHPLVLDQASGKVIDAVTGKAPNAGDKVQPKDQKGGPISDEDAKSIAEYYVKTGDNSRLNGLGITSAARQAVQKQIRETMDREKVSPEEMGTRVAEFAGRKAGQRTLSVQEAKMGSAAFEAEGAIKQARGVIERLPRTSFLPLNQLIEGYSNKTLNPDQTELYGRTQAIVNTYAAVMARGSNITTVSAQNHAENLLKTAGNPETFNRMLDTMLQEINMAKHSPAKMREFYRQQYGEKAVAPDGGSAPAAASGFTPPPGALPGKPDQNGKVWYYDPATKQPYPGQ